MEVNMLGESLCTVTDQHGGGRRHCATASTTTRVSGLL